MGCLILFSFNVTYYVFVLLFFRGSQTINKLRFDHQIKQVRPAVSCLIFIITIIWFTWLMFVWHVVFAKRHWNIKSFHFCIVPCVKYILLDYNIQHGVFSDKGLKAFQLTLIGSARDKFAYLVWFQEFVNVFYLPLSF